MKYFEKIAISKEEEQTYKRAPYRLVPYVGPYLGTPKGMRKEHPWVSALWGPPGSFGAKSKDTGKSYLEEAVKTEAAVQTGIGAVAGTVAGAMAGARGKQLAKVIAAATGIGAASGAAGGAIAYGGGKLFAGQKKKK
ncbi:hypothetical protein AYK24_00145 [Thermoplasmatales archaeon SG8-52-4]|nr:MAG: hypothetical protein AYK24_00145 [Thermoplasmatales archaeon SG8-52-4]